MEFLEDKDRKGFFKDYHKNVRQSVTNDQFNEFAKLKTDEEKIRYLLQIPSAHEINIKAYFKGKSEREAIEMKEAGNKAFGKKDYMEALKLYSHAVVKAPVPSGKYWKLIKENVDQKKMTLYAICLANRSAALFQLKDYYHCIRDIDEALEHHYPKELKYKLFKRKGKLLCSYKRHEEALDSFRQALKWVDWAKMEREKRIDQQNEIQKFLRLFESAKVLKNAPWEEVVLLPQMPEHTGEPNSKYPSLSNKISIEYSEENGRYAVATENIQPGEVLNVEKPYASVLLYEQFGLHCQNCFLLTKCPIPCKSCSSVLFCSVECRDASYFHKIECPIVDLLQGSGMSINCFLAFRILTQTPLNYFLSIKDKLNDIDLKDAHITNDTYKSDDYFILHNLVRHSEKRTPEDFFHRSLMAVFLAKALKKTKYYTDSSANSLSEAESFAGSLILRFLQIIQFNAHEVSEYHLTSPKSLEDSKNHSLGAAIYATLSLFNHSCECSQVRYFSGNKVITRAVKNLAKGDHVNENYGQTYIAKPRSARKRELADRYWFECQCEACVNDWPTFDKMDSNSLIFKCQHCRGGIPIRVDAPSPLIKCPNCNKDINVFASLKNMQNSEKTYNAACKEMEDFKLEKVKPLLIENLNQLDSALCQPYKDYHVTQEVLMRCYLYEGNRRLIHNMKNMD